MNSRHLIIFDFSGTLSLNAARFGRAERLTQALRDSGLWQLGARDLNLFWKAVASTWTEGATTSLGYAGALTKGLKGHLNAQETAIRRCASAFAADYFAQLTIHPAWTPILRAICADSSARVCVATDHYAEATAQIRAELAALGLSSGVFAANSADIGAFKAERAFWESVRAHFAGEHFQAIRLIDDFGANESAEDDYAAQEKIAARQAQTTRLLSELFRCSVEVFPFVLSQASEFNNCIARAAQFLNT